MVVGIFGLLLVSAVFLVRRGSEENGVKLVLHLQQKNDLSRAERRGERRDRFSRHKARKRPLWTGMSGLV
jgi:hypothetical protein